MYKSIIVVIAASLLLTIPTSNAVENRQPIVRQALYFDIEEHGETLRLSPQIDKSVNGLLLSFDPLMDDGLLAPLPTKVTISPTSEKKNDLMSLLLPSFGFEYHGELQESITQFDVKARWHNTDFGESTMKIQFFTGEAELSASLVLNTAAREAILIENRAHAMGGFLLKLVAAPNSDSPQLSSCLKRASNDSYVCRIDP